MLYRMNLPEFLTILFQDLGLDRSSHPEIHAVYRNRTDLKTFQASAARVADSIRSGEIQMGSDEASRSFQFLCVLQKMPGAKDTTEVLNKLVSKQTLIGNVHFKTSSMLAARRYVHGVLNAVDVFEPCKHGPGATAEKSLYDDKYYDLKRRPRATNWLYAQLDPLRRIAPVQFDDVPSRVIVVEKNWKGGRVIAAEQTSRQFLQQSIGRTIKAALEKSGLDLTENGKHKSFLMSGLEHLVTVDLSDASDFVSMRLAHGIIPSNWMKLINSTRSKVLDVPGHGLMKTKTVASMGNGYCFALLSLVCSAACCTVTGNSRPYKTWSVWGDDIIIHSRYYQKLVELLTQWGLIVNYEKTFQPSQPFAETCGMDIWRCDGRNVRPHYLRCPAKFSTTDQRAVEKLRSFQRFATNSGLSLTASYLYDILAPMYTDTLENRKLFRGLVLRSPMFTDIPGHINEAPGGTCDPKVIRYNPNLQRRECLALSARPKRRNTSLDASGSWTKAFFGSIDYDERSRSWVEVLARDYVPCLVWQECVSY